MPFDVLERSASLGRPEELYEFTSYSQTWRYTSADRPRFLNGFEYTPVRKMRRTRIKQDKDGGDDSFTITIPGDLDIAWMFRIITPSRPMWVRTYRRHRNDGEHFVQASFGRVRGCGWKRDGQAELECDGFNSLAKRTTLRLDYDNKCPHMLYDVGCTLDNNLWRVDGPLSGYGSNYVRSPAFATKPDGWFELGYVEFGEFNYMVTQHTGDRLTLFHNLETVIDGPPLIVTAYAGCDRTLEMCWEKFDNGLNSEANPWMPKRNPFESGL